MKGKENEGPKGKMKGYKLGNAAGLTADKICLNFIRKRAVFSNSRGGGPRGSNQQEKIEPMLAHKWRKP